MLLFQKHHCTYMGGRLRVTKPLPRAVQLGIYTAGIGALSLTTGATYCPFPTLSSRLLLWNTGHRCPQCETGRAGHCTLLVSLHSLPLQLQPPPTCLLRVLRRLHHPSSGPHKSNCSGDSSHSYCLQAPPHSPLSRGQGGGRSPPPAEAPRVSIHRDMPT